MDEPTFCLYFNKRRQWVSVYLWDVHPSTFANWRGGRWGYWEPERPITKSGYFGSLHFVKNRLRIDTIRHECDHVRQEWLRANLDAWTGRNEERIVEMGDRLLWGFLRELAKVEPKSRVWLKTLSEL